MSTAAWPRSPTVTADSTPSCSRVAGLERLGRTEAVGEVLDPGRFVPAPGQGTIVLEGRARGRRRRSSGSHGRLTRRLHRPGAERAVAAELDADCSTPLGAHATVDGELLTLRAWVGLADGSQWILDELSAATADPLAAGAALAERMRSVGAADLLALAAQAAA